MIRVFLLVVVILPAISGCVRATEPVQDPVGIERAQVGLPSRMKAAVLPFQAKVNVSLSRKPEPGDQLSILLRRNGKLLEKISGDKLDVFRLPPAIGGSIDIADNGRYEVTVMRGDEAVSREYFEVGSVPCFGGGRKTEVVQTEAPRVFVYDGLPVLEIPRWLPRDRDLIYRTEWRRDGQVIHVGEGEYKESPPLRTVAEKLSSERQQVPLWRFFMARYKGTAEILQSAGEIEVHISTEGQPTSVATFRSSGDGDIARTKETYREEHRIIGPRFYFTPVEIRADAEPLELSPDPVPEDKYPRSHLLATAGELRALTRSDELFKARIDFNERTNPIDMRAGRVEDQPDESPEMRWRRQKRFEASVNQDQRQENNRRKALAVKLQPALRKLIAEHSQPWKPSEHPLFDGG